jgi:hypothetical protein
MPEDKSRFPSAYDRARSRDVGMAPQQEPPVSARIRTLIFDALGGNSPDMAKRRRAMTAADMLTGAGAEFAVGMTPVLGDAQAMYEAKQAYDQGDMGRAAMLGGLGALGMVPVVGDAASKAGAGAIKRLFHGSYEVVPSVNSGGMFGGVFASPSKSSAASHGDIINSFDIPEENILTNYSLNYDIEWPKTESAIRKAFPDYDDLSEDQRDAFIKAVIEDESQDVDADDLMLIMGKSDIGDASWEAQRVRGKVASGLGFKAVEMSDEHGTSYLLLPGVVSKMGMVPVVGDIAKKGGEFAMDTASRMARAADQGFDTSRPLYHSTNASFDVFEIPENKFLKYGKGVYTSPNPDYVDRHIRENRDIEARYKEGANLMPLYARGKIGTEKDWEQARQEMLAEGVNPKGYNPLQAEIQRRLKEKGFDGVNMFGNETIIFDPSNIRSVNAAFDPAKRGSANLLAGGTATAVGVGAMTRSQQEEQNRRNQ